MANTKNYKNYIWTFPLLGGILTIIGLLTPFSMEDGVYSWLWGGNYFELGGDSYFYWTLEIYQDVPLIFISNITLFIILLITAIGSIIYSLMVWKTGDFKRYERKWLYLGILFIIATIVYLIEFEILMRYYYKEYFDLDASYWEFFNPGFGLIAPILSGGIILAGFGINKYFLPKKRDRYIKTKKFYRNIIYIFIIGISILFLGSLIIFMFFKLLPGDLVAAYIGGPFTQEQYDQMKENLGFELSIILQFFRFIGDFFTGDASWISVSINRPEKVFAFLKGPTIQLINFLVAPIFLGLFLGIILGNVSSRKKYTRIDKGIQVFCVLALSVPIFFCGILFQYFVCYKADLCSVTGNNQLAFLIFIIAIVPLIALQTRSFIVNKFNRRSIISHMTISGATFGFILLFYILVDVTFNLNGFGSLIVASISLYDYYVMAEALFIVLVLFVVTIIISGIILSSYKFIVGDFPKRSYELTNETVSDKEQESNVKRTREEIKGYILRRLKSPIFIIGSILVLFFIFISIFPQVLTEYSLQEATTPMAGAWSPPSSEHPLGQTYLGYDVLALIVYGIRNALMTVSGVILISLGGALVFMIIIWISNFIRSHIKNSLALTFICMLIYAAILGLILIPFMFPIFGLVSIVFGLICGAIFGFIVGIIYYLVLIGKHSRLSTIFYTRVDNVILGLMILFYIIPGGVLLITLIGILGAENWLIFYYLGILLIPNFMWVISNENSNGYKVKKVVKSIITYIPFNFALALLIYESIGFLGFSDMNVIQLGNVFSSAQSHFATAFHAVFWPGLAIFCILFSFLLLHIGLQQKRKNLRS